MRQFQTSLMGIAIRASQLCRLPTPLMSERRNVCSFTSVDWLFPDFLPVIDIAFETYRYVSNTYIQMGSDICEAIMYSTGVPNPGTDSLVEAVPPEASGQAKSWEVRSRAKTRRKSVPSVHSAVRHAPPSARIPFPDETLNFSDVLGKRLRSPQAI